MTGIKKQISDNELSDSFPSRNVLSKLMLQLLWFKKRCTEEIVSCSILLWLSFSTTLHAPEWQSCKTWRKSSTFSRVLMTSVESVRENLWFPCRSLETGFALDRMTTLWICLDEVWITKRSSNLPTLVC